MSLDSQVETPEREVAAPAPQPVVRRRHDHGNALLQSLLLVGDLLSAVVAVWLSYWVSTGPTHLFTGDSGWLSLVILAPCWMFAMFLMGHYSLRPARAGYIWAQQLAGSTLVGTFVAIGLTFIIRPSLLTDRGLYALATVAAWLLFGLVRAVGVRFGSPRLVRERVLLIGTDDRARALAEALTNGHNPNGAELVGAVRAGKEQATKMACGILGDLSEAAELLVGHEINHLVITPLPPLSNDLIECAAHGEALGARVQTMENAYEELTWRAPIFSVGEAWQASLESVSSGKYATRLKRVADLSLTILLLPLALAIIGVCALLVKLTSRGPAFYHQERVGKDGVPFTFTKLRTMVVDAEAKTGPVWATADDPRVTPIGRILRKMRIDELPQLFSVLRGDMSLIGPRPERAHFVSQFKKQIPLYEKRLMVRPGITGWAQVHHNYDRCLDDVVEKLRYDLYYIRHLSFSLDLQIIIKTIGVMLGKKGAH